jgi:hypothetical protein
VEGFGKLCELSELSELSFLLHGVFVLVRRPESGRATLPWLPALADGAKCHELFQDGVDTVATEMSVKEGADLLSGQSVGSSVEGLTDTVGGGVAGTCTEEVRSACGAIVPDRQSSLEMGQGND